MSAASVARPMQTALVDGHEKPVGPLPESVYLGDNAGLMAMVAPLYLTGSVLDVTYGRGAWWRRFSPATFGKHDLELDGVDFRALPYNDSSWDTVCFDPPYLPSHATHTTTKRALEHRAAYGLMEPRTRADVEALIADGLAECARVAKWWVLAKCCDYAENPTTALRLGHVSTIAAGQAVGLRVHDLIVHAYGNGGGPTNHRLRHIRRTRRTHSYLIVFKVLRGR